MSLLHRVRRLENFASKFPLVCVINSQEKSEKEIREDILNIIKRRKAGDTVVVKNLTGNGSTFSVLWDELNKENKHS